jgi:hypothetical protein
MSKGGVIMINELNIKNKDFSLDLPLIIAKLKIIQGSLDSESDKDIPDDISFAFMVLSEQLGESINELEIINKILYWPDEPADTAKQGAQMADNG